MPGAVSSMKYDVCSVWCSVCSLQCVVCSLQFAVCIVQCAVCSVQCAVCSVQCAVCSVQFAVCSAEVSICTICPTVLLEGTAACWSKPLPGSNTRRGEILFLYKGNSILALFVGLCHGPTPAVTVGNIISAMCSQSTNLALLNHSPVENHLLGEARN